MSDLESVENVIFDLDGTLWDATEAAALGWTRALKEVQVSQTITPAMMASVCGRPFEECVASLVHDTDHISFETLVRTIEKCEREEIERTGGVPYEGLSQVVAALAAEKKLFIVSNCQRWYLDTFLRKSGLESQFRDTMCYGNASLSKKENLARLMEVHQLSPARTLYVGDTATDQRAALSVGISYVHAEYGLGKPYKSATEVRSLFELQKLLLG